MTQQIINIGTGPSTGDGDPLRTAFNEVNSNFTELYGTINGQAVTFSNVSGVTTSLGNGATFDVIRYVNSYAPVINRAGTGYSVGNVITIYGNLIGGAYSAQDLTITVASLGNATLGNIATVTFSGIPAQPVTSVAGRTGNVVLTVNDIIGLSNAYAIASSTATANTAMRGYVDTKIAANIAALINGAPGALDTLQELAAALGNNASFSATIINSLATTNSNLIVSNTTTRAYVDGQIIAANSGVASAVTLANTGLKGYVDYTNSVQSTEIATANIGLKGYVDQANTIQSAQVNAANLAITAANVGIIGYIDQANTIQSAQVNAANLAITAANVGLKGYVDFTNSVQSTEIATANIGLKGYVDQANSIQSAQIAAANIGLKGYVDQANTIQSAQLTSANLGIIGYVDQANTIQSGQVGAANLAIIAANLGMKGYVDSVATLSIYSNVNVKAYTETMGFQNYSNVNVAAYVTTANSAILGYIDLANTIQSAQVNAANLAITAANVGMKGYVDSQSFYSNAKVATYLQAGNISNVSLAGNVTATYFLGNGALLTGIVAGGSSYSNVQVATYLPTYSGNIANVRLGTDGVLTFADGTTQTTASAGGGSNYGNANVAVLLVNYYGNIAANIVKGEHTWTFGINGNLTVPNNIRPQANVASDLGSATNRWNSVWTSSLNVDNVSATGNVTATYFLGNGALLTGITTSGSSNYSNVNVKAYAETMGYQNFGNVNVAAYVTTANSAILGYIDLANTIQSAQVNAANLAITAANLGMKGYVDSVASQSIYGNGNVKSYLTQFDGNIVPSANVTYSLGNVTNRWKDLYLSGNTIFLGDSTITTEGGRLVTTGAAISPPTGAVGFANVQLEAPTDFAQIRSYYVDNNFGYTANLKNYVSAPIVWDELRSAKFYENSLIIGGATPDFSALDTSGGRFANAVATIDATGNIASLTITDGGLGYDSYYPYYATDPTGYDSNYIGRSFTGAPTGKSYRRISLIPTTASDVGNITSIASFNRYSGLPTVGSNSYTWTGNTGTTISFTVDWSSNTVTSYTYTPTLPALTSANDWQNWILDYQNTNDYGWWIGSGGSQSLSVSSSSAIYDYLFREALPSSLTYDLSNTTWYPGNLLVNNSASIATLSSQTMFVSFNRTAIGWAKVENSYGNPVYWLRGLTADSGISTGGDMTVAGDLRVAGDLYVSPTSIYMGNLRISAADGNLTVNTGVKFSDGSVQSSAYSNVKVKAYTESMGYQNYGNVNVAALITTNGLTNYSNVNVIAYLAGNITVGNIAGSVNGFSIGYRDVPQITVANLTLIASDAGKHYYGANTNPTTITIPLNSSVAFGNGTAISIVNQGTGNITVANAAGVLLYLAGNSTASSRTLTSYGMATLIKVQVNTWFINGTGVV